MTNGITRWLLIGGRLILGGIFLYSGYEKLREPWLQFVVSIDSFKLLPEYMLEPLAKTLPWCEVALGIGLVSGLFARWFSLIATLMLAAFVAAAARGYAMGLQIDCGCFGAGGDPVGPKWFVEHGAMLLVGVLVTAGAFIAHRRRSGVKTSMTPVRGSAELAR